MPSPSPTAEKWTSLARLHGRPGNEPVRIMLVVHVKRKGEKMKAVRIKVRAAGVNGLVGRFQSDGLVAAPGDDDRLQQILGRPTRSYRDFARETAASWSD